LAKNFSKYANNEKIWKYINYSIITFMSILVLYIFFSII
jgi:L-lysine exporter family protein LysE/ArgO